MDLAQTVVAMAVAPNSNQSDSPAERQGCSQLKN
jgi:hypothetical protein